MPTDNPEPTVAPTAHRAPAGPPLVEGLDYTIEAGRWVFTARYLLRRGECCGTGCRHCPYPKPAPRPDGPAAASDER